MRSVTPVKAALLAVALRLLQVWVASALSVTKASAISAPVRFRPMACAVPPSRPAKALSEVAPKVMTRAATTRPSAKVTSWSACWNMNWPDAWTKPNTSRATVALACSKLPKLPAMLRAKLVPTPVATDSEVLPAL